MKQLLQRAPLLAPLLCGVLVSGLAHAAPGEDPIALSESVEFVALPTPGPAPSTGLDGSPDLPAWSRARISRYVAKAFSATADDGTIQTDKDVTTTVKRDGFKTTCVQEVGSVSAPPALGEKYGPNKREQVVVLRGDLVNVCR